MEEDMLNCAVIDHSPWLNRLFSHATVAQSTDNIIKTVNGLRLLFINLLFIYSFQYSELISNLKKFI